MCFIRPDYVVAHFHYVLSLAAVFAIFVGWYYWFPKITGYVYSDFLGKFHFWISFIGANTLFFPMHFLGLAGMPRRVADYPDAYAGWNFVASIGAYVFAAGMVVFFAEHGPCIRAQTARRRESMGPRCDDAGVDATLAAAFPSI